MPFRGPVGAAAPLDLPAIHCDHRWRPYGFWGSGNNRVRVLFVIPHFFKATDPRATNRSTQPQAQGERLRALTATISSLHQTFGTGHGLDHFRRIAWCTAARDAPAIEVVVCTAGDAHLLGEIDPYVRCSFRHHAADVEPLMLGFECHRLLADARGRYDYHCYVEDDIIITDALFFRKLRLFNDAFGDEALLQPNRYEVKPEGPVRKLYVDYDLAPRLTSAYQDVTCQPRLQMPFLGETVAFERTCYPSAGCFFLSAEQLGRWAGSPAFCDRDISYLSPLDSAATLSIMKTFRVYKAALAQAAFLEVQHASPRWIAGATQLAHIASRDEAGAPMPQRSI
jgi:hypothetical protein